jgi:isopenicillin N synthase-like dioxygenase
MSPTPPLIADAIPMLDVSAYLAGERAALDTLAAGLRWAFEHVGFYYLRGHGIDRSLIDATYAAAASLHAQPLTRRSRRATERHGAGSIPP